MEDENFEGMTEETVKYISKLMITKDIKPYALPNEVNSNTCFVYERENVNEVNVFGNGMKSIYAIEFYKKSLNNIEKGWHLVEEEQDKKQEEDELDEDVFRIFLEENTIETNTKRYICKLCSSFKKKLEYEKMKKHFIDNHEKDYNASKYVSIASFLKAVNFSDKCDEVENDDSLDDKLFDQIFDGFGGKGKNKMNDDMLLEEFGKMLGLGSGFGGGKKGKKK